MFKCAFALGAVARTVAIEAIHALHRGDVRGYTTFISSTPGKIKKPESLCEPNYTPRDGCRAWVIKTP